MRTTVRRRIETLTASTPMRVLFGLSSRATQQLVSERSAPCVSLHRPAHGQSTAVTLARMMNAVIDSIHGVIDAADVRQQMLIIEDAEEFVSNPFVASYLVGAAEQLNASGLALIISSPWPSGMFPPGVLGRFATRTRWGIGFQCLPEDQELFREYFPAPITDPMQSAREGRPRASICVDGAL